MRISSVLTGIDYYDYCNSMDRQCFGWACDRCCVFPGVGDRTRLIGRRVPLSRCSSLPWFRLGKCWLDIAGISCSAPKLLCVGCIHQISDDVRRTSSAGDRVSSVEFRSAAEVQLMEAALIAEELRLRDHLLALHPVTTAEIEKAS